MLPFLKQKRAEGGVITQHRMVDEDKVHDSEDLSGLEMAMEDFCRAEEIKDYRGMAQAFKAAFEMLEMAPHEEYPHEE